MTTAAQRLAQRRAQALLRPPVDISDQISSDILEQGPGRPTCVACALASGHEGERNEPGFEPAVEPVWWHLVNQGKANADGTLLSDGVVSLADVGQCNDADWPYNKNLGPGTEDPPSAAGSPPWTRARGTLFQPAHDGVEEEIEDELADGHPIVAIIEVTDQFRRPQKPDGFVILPTLRAPSGGYHAVLLTGAWTDPVRGRVFLTRNSWGDWWGAGGYCLLPVEYFVAYCGELARLEI